MHYLFFGLSVLSLLTGGVFGVFFMQAAVGSSTTQLGDIEATRNLWYALGGLSSAALWLAVGLIVARLTEIAESLRRQ